MATSSTTWQKGQSGNPNGRPPKNEAWSDLLRNYGNKTVEDIDGKKRAGKRVIVRVALELATTGSAELPGGKRIEVNGDAWFDVVKWIFDRVDGKPTQPADFTTGGEPLTALTVHIDGGVTD